MNRFLAAIVGTKHDAYEGIPADTTDALLTELWLDRRPPHTQRAYRSDVAGLFSYTRKDIKHLDLLDLQQYTHFLLAQGLSEASVARRLSAVKSLLSFAAKTKYTPFNVGAALILPKVSSDLAGRILGESLVQKMLALETNPRNHALLRLLYGGGLRVSELCGLTWHDITPNGESGQVHIIGKGQKERYVLLSVDTYHELLTQRKDAEDDVPVFPSRKKHGHLDTSQVNRIVHLAACRAGIMMDGEKSKVSPHWLRHAHASHSLDRGAPITLVRDTLGHGNVSVTNKYLHARPNDSSANYLSV